MEISKSDFYFWGIIEQDLSIKIPDHLKNNFKLVLIVINEYLYNFGRTSLLCLIHLIIPVPVDTTMH